MWNRETKWNFELLGGLPNDCNTYDRGISSRHEIKVFEILWIKSNLQVDNPKWKPFTFELQNCDKPALKLSKRKSILNNVVDLSTLFYSRLWAKSPLEAISTGNQSPKYHWQQW